MLQNNDHQRLVLIREKVEAGQRLDFDDGLFLDPSTPGKNSPIVGELMKLAEAADAARRT